MRVPPEAAATPLQIVMVSHYFEDHRGGIEIVAGRLARELSYLGHRIVWAATGSIPSDPAWKPLSLRAWNGTERLFGVPFPLPSPGAADSLAAACAGADAIIVHDALYPTSIIARLSGRRSRRPVMIVQHVGAIAYRNPVLRLMMRVANRLVARPMLGSADQVVFISETTRAHFDPPAGRPAATIFNGVDVDIFRPAANDRERAAARQALGLSSERPVALFVGRFVEKKGLHWLRELAVRHPGIDWALAGWGPIDPAAWGLANVRIFGSLSGSSLADLYRAADLFVLPSIGEGFPLVVQEALACGLPVLCGEEVARAHPAATPLLHGVALDGGDADRTAAALSNAVTRLLAVPADRAARHRFARDHYSWASVATAYDALIRGMMRRAEGRGDA